MREDPPPYYVVWGDKGDYPPGDGFNHIGLEEVSTLKDCSVVIEDIISPGNKVLDHLRKLFHKIQRHHNLKLWFVSHTATKNNTYSLLPLYHEVILTRDAANHEVFKLITHKHQFPAEEASDVWNDFCSGSRAERHYLIIDNKEKSFRVTDSKGNPPRLGFEDLTKRIKTILASIFEGKKLDAQVVLLDHIFAPPLGVDRDLINSDLSMTLEGSSSGDSIKISLVDYLAAITDEEGEEPGYKIEALHEYISSRIQIPNLLIKNKHLQEE